MKKNQSQKKKNPFIIVGVVLLSLCVIFSIFNVFFKNKEIDSIMLSPLGTNQILYRDMKNTIKEIPADTFLVISYTGDLAVHKIENEISEYLSDVNYLDSVYYLDLKDYLENEDFYGTLNKNLGLKKNNKIEKLPAVIFYKDSKVERIVDSKKQDLSYTDFKSYIEYIRKIN